MAQPNVYENPEKIPLEKLILNVKVDGVFKNIPALDAYFSDKRFLSYYIPIPKQANFNDGTLETWIENTKMLLDDLKWLLSLDQHRFWCNILYHSSCMDMLVSFLQEANPPYLSMCDNKTVVDLYNQVYMRIFIIFSRLITNKEAEDKMISKSYFSEMIYDKFLFTLPIMWDLCLVYGLTNGAHIAKLMNYVFTLQPKYYDDLVTVINFLKQVYEFVDVKFNNKSSVLPKEFKGFSKNFGGLQSAVNLNEKLTLSTAYDLILHILDSSVTIRIFLELHTPARKIFKENDFHSCILNFYENTIVKMYEKIEELCDKDEKLEEEIFNHLDNMRTEFIDSYRFIINMCIEDILANIQVEENVQNFLTIITDALSEKVFIKDYNNTYPVEDDLDILCQACNKIDPMKCDFIIKAVMSHYDEPSKKNNASTSNDGNSEIAANILENNIPSTSWQNEIPSTNQQNEIPEEAKVQSLISEVQDILPDLGDGFVLECLRHYDFNTATVINCLLEGNLDEALQKLDSKLPIIPKDKLDEQYLKTGIERLNIFDNDEFDVMTRDSIDTSRVYRGKKKLKHKNLSQMLNDKSYIKDMKDKYVKYSVVSDDDEYDDTYDDPEHHVVNEATGELDRRNLLKPSPLRGNLECQAESEDESEDNDNNQTEKPRDQFCVNPEELRAKYQAKRDLKYNKKSSAERDLVGKAKGQGQDKDVLFNRHKKEASKSTRANHNRRMGSQWKRNQGMVPS